MRKNTIRRRLLVRWKIIVAILALFGIGSSFAYTSLSYSWDTYLLIQSGATTSGYITDLWEDGGVGGRDPVPWDYGGSYTYKLSDGRVFTGELNGKGLFKEEFRSLSTFSPIEVTYLPNDPAISLLSVELPDNMNELTGDYFMDYLVSAIFLGMGLYLLIVLIREERLRNKEIILEGQRQFDELTKKILDESRKLS